MVSCFKIRITDDDYDDVVNFPAQRQGDAFQRARSRLGWTFG